MPEDPPDEERTLIREGRDFEPEYRLDAAEAGTFLVDLANSSRTATR